MERNLTDAFIIGKSYRFQFDGVFATNWVYLVAIIPPCWVLVAENKDDNINTELINLNNVARVFGWGFNKGDIEERN